MPSLISNLYQFGDFTLDLQRRRLRRGEEPVSLTPKGLDVLLLLIRNAGKVVSKDELLKAVWPDTFVEDSNLTQTVFILRKALGETPDHRYILTVQGQGYRFLPEVKEVASIVASATQAVETAPVAAPQERVIPLWVRLALGSAIVLALIAGAIVVHRVVGTKAGPAIKSLAVLPLKNLSGDPGQEYLADGITEELIGRLSRLHDVRVISRTSVTRFKNTQSSAPEISKMLGADALVEGSVIRDGNRIRVHAQLIRGATDEHVWSESYDRELPDLLTLESDVAQAVAERVEVTVSGAEHQQLAKVRSVSPEVYELYLKGRFALSRSKKEADVLEAIRYFEEAKVRDGTFAPADVGLAIGHALLGSILVGAAPPEGERAKAISAAQRALQLDPELPEAYVVLAELHQNQWHWSEAEAEYRRALVLNPNDANAHAKLALWLLCQRRTEEALNWVNRARELDPLAVSGDLVGWTLYITRRYSEAIDELRTASATKPDDIGVLWRLGFVLIADNEPGEAIPVLEKALRITNRSPGVTGVLAKAYALSGQRSKAIALVDELQRRRETHYVSAAAFVNAYLGLGEIDQVFLWLEQGFKEQSNLMQWLAVDPMFDPLRSDARFVDLVRRVGLG
jgi:TolB-like protein/DNA-binding winged helix-turn-helix (wHTH) protein/Tfp pilus assembly protein PilF